MKFAYYTTLFTLKDTLPGDNDRIMMFYIWLYYFYKSGSVTNDDSVYVITDDITNTFINDSIIFRGMQESLGIGSTLKFITVEQSESYGETLYKKFMSPVMEILMAGEPDFIFYSDLNVIIKKSVRELFTKGEQSHCFITFNGHLVDIMGDTEWYKTNEVKLKGLPSICPNIFCVQAGKNELSILKQIYKNSNDEKAYLSEYNYCLYSMSQYAETECYLMLHYENIYENMAVNNITSDKTLIGLLGNDRDVRKQIEKSFTLIMHELLMSSVKS